MTETIASAPATCSKGPYSELKTVVLTLLKGFGHLCLKRLLLKPERPPTSHTSKFKNQHQFYIYSITSNYSTKWMATKRRVAISVFPFYIAWLQWVAQLLKWVVCAVLSQYWKELPCIGNDTASTSAAGHLHFEMHLGCGISFAGVDAWGTVHK